MKGETGNVRLAVIHRVNLDPQILPDPQPTGSTGSPTDTIRSRQETSRYLELIAPRGPIRKRSATGGQIPHWDQNQNHRDKNHRNTETLGQNQWDQNQFTGTSGTRTYWIQYVLSVSAAQQ